MKRNEKGRFVAETSEAPMPQPMDPDAPEGSQRPNNQRKCYTLETLEAEVMALLPETVVSYGEPSPRGVIFDAVFTLDEAEPLSQALMRCIEVDTRVSSITVEEGQAAVDIRRHPLLQDSRSPFGLAEAWKVMTEEGSL